MTYSELLKDPRWQRRRLEILSRDNFTCQICEDREKTLHVHHKFYESGKKPWEYPDEALVTLCFNCHEEEEGNVQTIKDEIKEILLAGGTNFWIAITLWEFKNKLTGKVFDTPDPSLPF